MLIKAKKEFGFWHNGKSVKLKTGEVGECDVQNYNTYKISYGDFIQVLPLMAIAKKDTYFEGVFYKKGDYLEININSDKQRYNNIKSGFGESFRFIETIKDYEEIKKEYGLDQEPKQEEKQKRIRRTQEEIKKDNLKQNDNN